MPDPELDREEWIVALREALREWADVPQHVLQAGYAAYSWRTIDAELAALTYDSSSAEAGVAVTRSPERAGLRTLSFESPALTIELQIGLSRVFGQLVPAQHADLVLARRDGARTSVGVDEIGCFTIEPLPEAPFRLEVDHEPRVVTDWIALSAADD